MTEGAKGRWWQEGRNSRKRSQQKWESNRRGSSESTNRWLTSELCIHEKGAEILVRNSSRKAKRSKRLLPAVAEREFGVRVQQVNYLQEKKIPQRKLTVFWESIIYITNIQHTSKITWLATKEEMCRTVKRKSRQKKLTHKIIKLLIGISRKEILRKVKTIFKDIRLSG